MILVLGSRHDPVAAALVRDWPRAALCSAQDLTRAGWCWHSPAASAGPARWVVDGQPLDDEQVSGVFVRRSTVYAQELQNTHHEDRSYLASELHALLVFVLASTRARVANPVADGGMGDEALRHERWLPVALACGLRVAPLRLASGKALSRHWQVRQLQAVGEQVFGAAPPRVVAAVSGVLQRLGLQWAHFIFDARWQLRSISCASTPGREAAAALGRLLSLPRP